MDEFDERDMKGTPDAFPPGFMLVIIIAVGLIFYYGHHHHKEQPKAVAPATASTVCM